MATKQDWGKMTKDEKTKDKKTKCNWDKIQNNELQIIAKL